VFTVVFRAIVLKKLYPIRHQNDPQGNDPIVLALTPIYKCFNGFQCVTRNLIYFSVGRDHV